MAEQVIFDGVLYTEPVSKARILGGTGNVAAVLSFGNIVILDTGIGAGWGGGLGVITGSTTRQLNEVLNSWSEKSVGRAFVKGGVLWDLMDYFYNPSPNLRGATKMYFLKCAVTAPSSFTYTFASAGELVFDTKKDEGLIANGTLINPSSDKRLYKGYGTQLIAGREDTAKFIIQFFLGTWRGEDSSGNQYEGVVTKDIAADNPQLIIESDEIDTVADFEIWATNNPTFSEYFTISDSTAGAIAAADLTTYDSMNVFAGGTESYSATALDEALALIPSLDNTFFFTGENEDLAAGTNNLTVLAHIVNDADFKKFLVVGGHDDKTGFTKATTGSIDAANVYDSQYVIFCHGGEYIPDSINPSNEILKDSNYFAAKVLGALAGGTPEQSITYKKLRQTGRATHILTKSERELAIENGVLHMRLDDDDVGAVVNLGLNTLQGNRNKQIFNQDGSSYLIAIQRIAAQLNREIQVGGKAFIGENRSTVTESDVIEFVTDLLAARTANPDTGESGYIIGFRNVTATRNGTTWNATYEFAPNSEITKFFATGTMIDSI